MKKSCYICRHDNMCEVTKSDRTVCTDGSWEYFETIEYPDSVSIDDYKKLQAQLEKAEDVLKEISRQTHEVGMWTDYTYEAILAQKYFEQKEQQ